MIQDGRFKIGNEVVEAYFLPEDHHTEVGLEDIPGPCWIVLESSTKQYAVDRSTFEREFTPIDACAFKQLKEAGVDLSNEDEQWVSKVFDE